MVSERNDNPGQQFLLIGLGANLTSPVGAPRETIKAAVRRLDGAGVRVRECSAVYETVPVPASGQPNFINCAIAATTSLSAASLLDMFQTVERDLGRQEGERWSARTLDIDLLAYGQSIFPTIKAWQKVAYSDDPAAYLLEPVVPHPRLHKRAFVLVPLQDVMPNWQHPCLLETVTDMVKSPLIAEQLSDIRKVSDKL